MNENAYDTVTNLIADSKGSRKYKFINEFRVNEIVIRKL